MNPNQKIPDDLLSAFYDRELTRTEEALAKDCIHLSPAAKAELQAYERLSSVLRELPRETVPVEFAAAVMQRAERETLIPIESARKAAGAGQSQPLSRRAWIFSGVGVASAAVILVLLSFAIPSRRDRRSAESAQAVARDSRAPVSVASIGDERKRLSEVKRSAAQLPESSDTPSVAAASGGAAGWRYSNNDLAKVTSDKQVPLLAAKSAAIAVQQKSPALGSRQLVLPANLKTAQVGDVIEALEKIGQQVAVVRLTVVNQAAGLDGIQSLLVREASRMVQSKSEQLALRERFKDQKAGLSVEDQAAAGNGGLICVYLEGTRDQLAGVLSDLQSETRISQAQLTNTISPAKLAQYADGVVGAPSPRRDSQASANRVVSLPPTTVDKILSANERLTDQLDLDASERTNESRVRQSNPSYAATPSPASAPVPKSGPAPAAQQLGTQAPQRRQSTASAAQNGPRFAGAPASGPDSRSETAPRADLARKEWQAASTSGKVAAAAQRSYQVFFVLDDLSIDRSQATAKKQAPASAAAPQAGQRALGVSQTPLKRSNRQPPTVVAPGSPQYAQPAPAEAAPAK